MPVAHVNSQFRSIREEKRKKRQENRNYTEMEKRGVDVRGVLLRRLCRGLLSFAVGVFAAKVIKAAAKYIFGFADSSSPPINAVRNFFF